MRKPEVLTPASSRWRQFIEALTDTIVIHDRPYLSWQCDGDSGPKRYRHAKAVMARKSPPCRRQRCCMRANKPNVFELLQSERRAVVQYANHFQSSPPRLGIHCGGDGRADHPSAVIFFGSGGAELHARCHTACGALQEFEARAALGNDQPDKRAHRAG